jgi:hypothetical protein
VVLRSVEEAEQAIEDVLRLDVRTVHAKHKHTERVYGVCLDLINFVFEVDESSTTAKIIRAHEWTGSR